MTFTELLDEVYGLTNRPDLVAQTKSAIKAATLKAHNTDYYSKDIYELGIQFNTKDYRQSFDLYNFISNFRAIKYLRKADSVTDDNGRFIDIVTPGEVLDSYGRNRADIAYVAGRVLEVRSSTAIEYALFGCYVRPIVTEAAYSSWIAELHPFAIIYEAARSIFKLVGYDEEAASYNGLVLEEYRLLTVSNISDVGY